MSFFTIFHILTEYYPASAVGMVVAGYWLLKIERTWLRISLFLSLALLAPMLLVFEGLVTGCAVSRSGEACYWFGFGMVIATGVIAPLSTLCLGIGMLVSRVFGPISKLVE